MRDTVHLTRRYWFSASHRLHNPALAEGENLLVYGKCNNPGGHGHNYHVEITIAGPVNPQTGMVVDLAELDGMAEREILARFDQTNLNDDAAFAALVPTTENLCVQIHRIVQERWRELPSAREARLERIRLEETSSNFFEYTGE